MAQQAQHVIVAGPSGGGKSTYLRELHAKHDGASIFLTTKANERTAQLDPPMRVRESSAEYPRDISTARAWARMQPHTTQVIVDEVQNAPTFHGDDGPVRKMLHEDREAGVKAVIATQNPQDLHTSEWRYGPLQQAQFVVWVGPARTWHRGFREWLNLEADQLPSQNYTYYVIKPSDPPKIVAKGTTKEEYS